MNVTKTTVHDIKVGGQFCIGEGGRDEEEDDDATVAAEVRRGR